MAFCFPGVLLGCLAAIGCSKPPMVSGEFSVRSPAFASGEPIPKRHAYSPEGENVSPALEWSGAPADTKEWVVIVEDPIPQREIFVSWVAYGIPGSMTGLPEGIPADQPSAAGVVQGTNDFGHLGWGGPLPHAGDAPHRFWFWVYALDAKLNLEPGATKADVVKAMTHHILANGKMFGTYKR